MLFVNYREILKSHFYQYSWNPVRREGTRYFRYWKEHRERLDNATDLGEHDSELDFSKKQLSRMLYWYILYPGERSPILVSRSYDVLFDRTGFSTFIFPQNYFIGF